MPPDPIVTRDRPPPLEDGRRRGSTAPAASGPCAALGFVFRTWSIVSRRTWPECWRAETSLGQSSISSWASTPPRPTTVGTERQTSRMPYVPLTSDETGQDALLVEGDGVDDLADRQADGEARAALELDDLGAAASGPGEERLGRRRGPAGELLQRQPPACAADQIGTMLSPCSPRIMAVTWVAGSFRASAIRLRNRAVSSCVPRPMTCVGGQAELGRWRGRSGRRPGSRRRGRSRRASGPPP